MTKLQWNIVEPLSFTWDGELVHLDPPTGMDAGSLASVRSLTCGDRRVAAQFDDQAGRLTACLTLDADAEITLLGEEAPAAPTGLTVERRAGCHVVRSRRFAVAFAADPTVIDGGAEWRVTGPIAWIEGPDGAPRTSSRLAVDKSAFFDHDRQSIARVDPAKIEADEAAPTVKAEIVASGDVFVRYRYVLRHPGGGRYEFTATVYADQPLAYVDEQSDLGRSARLELDLSDRFSPDLYFHGGQESRKPQNLVPVPPTPYRIGSLAPHHAQTHTAYPWLGLMISDRPQGTFRGIQETGVEPYADTLTLMAWQPIHWRYPSETAIQFEVEEGRRVVARGEIGRGRRTWCMIAADRREVLTPIACDQHDRTQSISIMTRWYRKLTDLPLDWVRRLDLESGAVDGTRATGLTADERRQRSTVFRQIADRLDDELAGDSPDALYARWMLRGDREAAAALAGKVERIAESKLALFLNGGFVSDRASPVALRSLGPAAAWYEAALAAGAFDAATARRLRRILLLFAHASAGDALFPCHQNYRPPHDPMSIRNWTVAEQYSTLFGTPNFQTDVYYNLGLFGAVFADHPQAGDWRADAAQQLDQQLDFHFHAGGVYTESIGYFVHLFHNMLHLASVLRRCGQRDFFADPRFQGAMHTLVDYVTAPQRSTVEREYEPGGKFAPFEGERRMWPAIGDTGRNCKDMPVAAMIAHAGWEVREHDEALSEKLLACWAETGKPLWGAHAPKFEYLYVRDLAPDTPALAGLLDSRQFHGTGVQMRADVGEPTETSVFFRVGKATHHWGFDLGHFSIVTRGSRLVPDFGYHGTDAPEGEFVHGSATWAHNVVTFGPDWNGDVGMELRRPPVTVRLGEAFDYVVADLSMNNVRREVWRNIQPIAAVEYFRHLLFARNRYLVIWDRITRSIYPSQLRINCLARSVEIAGNELRFAGLDGVDLRVHVASPASPTGHEAMLGPMRYVLIEQACELDYLWVCQPLGPDEPPVEIASSPTGLTIAGTDARGGRFTDVITLAPGETPPDTNPAAHHFDDYLAVERQE